MLQSDNRKIVIVNQAATYLTIGIANAFLEKAQEVALITGRISDTYEKLSPEVKVSRITEFSKDQFTRPSKYRKILNIFLGLLGIFWLLNTKYKKHEVFFIGFPPMGYLLNLFTFNRFSMLIWDVYPDTLKISGMSEDHVVYKCWSRLNKLSFKRAHKLFTIGEKMAESVAQYVDRDRVIVQPIWALFQENNRISKNQNEFIKKHGLDGQFIIQYSGNIGVTHKVEVLIEIAGHLKDFDKITFVIIGKGNRVSHLKRLVKEKGLKNCLFFPFQDNNMFQHSLSSADIGVVILDELTAKGSVPSKAYNLMSYGVPSLYISAADSELNIYAQKYGHAECFQEARINDAAQFILSLFNDRNKHTSYARNAEKASLHFKRDNADKIVEKYFS